MRPRDWRRRELYQTPQPRARTGRCRESLDEAYRNGAHQYRGDRPGWISKRDRDAADRRHHRGAASPAAVVCETYGTARGRQMIRTLVLPFVADVTLRP